MQLNRCCRCGCFFTSAGDVCPNCMQRDMYEMSQLKSFLEESDTIYTKANITSSLDSISQSTGISIQNLNRFLSNESFSEFNIL